METPIKKEDFIPGKVTPMEDLSKITPVDEPKKVEVDPGVLKGILEKLDVLEQAGIEKDKQIEHLRGAVNKGRLEAEENKDKKVGPPTAKLALFEGKPVLSFTWVKKEYMYNPLNPNTPAGENLQIKLKFVDGTESLPIQYVTYIRNINRVEIEKRGEKDVQDEQGNVYHAWIAQIITPGYTTEEIVVDPQFINP